MSSTAAPHAPLELAVGPLSLRFEPATGMLRYLRVGETEVLRGIYGAVRDRNWDTVTPVLRDLHIDKRTNQLHIAFHADCRGTEIDFTWRGAIEVEAAGQLTYRFRGRANATFLRNRIGLCVLHPAEAAGAACQVEHCDGSHSAGAFPRLIAPHQPWRDLREITHQVGAGLSASVRCDGDVFEMEDQRNWTDASFKIYSTPLALPFPVEVTAGTVIEQSVKVILLDHPRASPRESGWTARMSRSTVTCSDRVVGRCPAIGLGSANHASPLEKDQVESLRAMNLAHLRVDLHLAATDWPASLRQALAQAGQIGTALELAVFVTDNADSELRALAETLAEARASGQSPLSRVLLFHEQEPATPARFVSLARRLLACRLGGGTNAYFAELNRHRPPVGELDVVCYSLNPQVHANDDATLIESLPVQGTTVLSARSFCGAVPIAVTPVTLKPRFNPNATAPVPARGLASPLPLADPRQASPLLAGWTLGSIKYLAEAGASSLTYYETTGHRGVMPDPCPDTKVPFPLYHVLRDAGQLRGHEILRTQTSDPWKVVALAIRDSQRINLLLANLTDQSHCVCLVDHRETLLIERLCPPLAYERLELPASFLRSAQP